MNVNETGHIQPQQQMEKRTRRKKNELDGRNFQCTCMKSYLSQAALNNHKKTKHPEFYENNGEKRKRGRPRIHAVTPQNDFETSKYDNFFNSPIRMKHKDQTMNLEEIVKKVFNSIFVENKDKCYSHPKNEADQYLLNSLLTWPQIGTEPEKKSCDEVLYEYLLFSMEQSNPEFFTLVIKFTILFRECFNQNANKENGQVMASCKENASSLPNLCNAFYTEFLESNEFFGICDEQQKAEIIELIQHLCTWLLKSRYTSSKLTLA